MTADAVAASALPAHAASGRLALVALCGDLVIAIDAMAISSIVQAAETRARAADRGGWLVELDGAIVPGWDLGELLGLGACSNAWVIVDLPRGPRIALRVGRCVMVQSLPVCRAIPPGVFTARGDALAAAFSAATIPELDGHVSGVVIELATLLGQAELSCVDKRRSDGRDPTV